jgi:ligand-binding sensor domain-containing protein/serine phosphatase RsbU (regulator of sigma subunit)
VKNFVYILFVFIIAIACDRKENDKLPLHPQQEKKTEEQLNSIGKIQLASPKILAIDERVLKKIPVGNPKIVPAHLNIHQVGELKKIIAENPLVNTPGKDTFSEPQVFVAIDSPRFVRQPQIINALPLRMKDAAKLDIQFIGVDQGMSSSYIKSLYADRKGYLWIGTHGEGVSRYDGKSFLHFTEKQGLSNTIIMSILEDKDGNLWFGTNGGGINKYDGKTITCFTEKEGLSNNYIRSIYQDKKGNIWIGTSGGGVSKYDGKSFTHYTIKQGLSHSIVLSIIEDKNGNMWFGTHGGGLNKFDGKSFFIYTEKNGLSNNFIKSMLEDKKGNIWLGTVGGGVNKFDGKYFWHYTVNEGLSNNTVNTLLEDSLGNIWIGTSGGGANKFDVKSFTHFTQKEGMSENNIMANVLDNSGNLWFGNNGSGISRLNWRSFYHITEDEGLIHYTPSALLEDKKGNIWVGTNEGELCKYDGENFTQYNIKEILNQNTIESIEEDAEGKLWIGTYGGGLIKFDGKYFTHFSKKKGYIHNTTWCILKDKNNNLWFGTNGGGLMKYDGKNYFLFTENEGLSSNTIIDMIEDRKGNLWFGTEGGGVSKFDGKFLTNYSVKDGLAFNTIRSIFEDKDGNIWLGTNGGGISKFDGNRFINYTTNEGLTNNNVVSIIQDKAENIWVGTERGLNCFVKNKSSNTESNHRNNNESCNYRITTFTKEDGLKVEDFMQNTVLLDKKNRMWWGTGKALSILDMNHFKLNDKQPKVQLENILLQENLINFSTLNNENSDSLHSNLINKNFIKFTDVSFFHNLPENLELNYELNHLTFTFSVDDWYAPHKSKFQYMLEGLDADWSYPTSDSRADYRNIPFGKYTFKVKAIGNSGIWSETNEFDFVIHPPWWRTIWAYLFYVILLIGFLIFIIRWNGKRLRAKAKELEIRVEAATSEIKEQKKLIEEKADELATRHKEITDSINYAERIQRSFLATKDLLDENLKDYFVFFQPKDVVSGDFYWASKLNNGSFAYICADSTGHGVPGAIMSIANISCLKESITKGNTHPSEILNETRRLVIDYLKNDGTIEGGKDGMDASLIVFNKEKNKLTYSAANNPIWIIRKNEMGYPELLEAKPDKMPIGKHDKDSIPFKQYEIELQKDDLIYSLTDGMPDQFGGPKGKKYKYTQLKEFLLSISALSMPEQHLRLKSEFESWKGDLEQIDDVCVIGVRV